MPVMLRYANQLVKKTSLDVCSRVVPAHAFLAPSSAFFAWGRKRIRGPQYLNIESQQNQPACAFPHVLCRNQPELLAEDGDTGAEWYCGYCDLRAV